MAKHTTKEAYFERLKELANANKPSIKESKTRNLGSLIDYKRAADGVAYGIVKENHLYYLKKAGIKQDPDVADFAYIGGLSNINDYKYKSLSEADKQRNFIFHDISEANALRPDKNGSKKKRLNEDKASDEISQAASKVGDLDAATSAEEVPAELPAPEGGDEMTAGLGAKPEGEPAPEEVPAEPAPEETSAPEGEPEGEPAPEEVPAGDEETPEGGAEIAADVDEPNREIEKTIGKLTNKIRKTEMEDSQVKSYINSFLVSFKDKLRDIDIEDRKEMANKLLKVVGQEEIEDLGSEVPQDGLEGKPEEGGVEEDACVECGGFGKYAESRGYGSPESFMECGAEEQANVISGYANAHNDGMNDGDFKTVAIVITPEILDKLKGDYGHEEYAEKLTPYTNELSEATEEDKLAQLNELWGGLGALGRAAGAGIKKGAQAVGGALQKGAQAVGGAVQKGAQAVGNVAKAGAEKVGQAATAVKQTYHAGEVPGEVKKLESVAANLGKQIAALNTRLQKAGQQPVNVQSILTTIKNQLGAGGGASLGKYGAVAEDVDPANVPVQPVNILKEEDKPEAGETPEHEKGETSAEEKAEHEPSGEEFEVGGGAPKFAFGPDSQSLGVGTIKPDGAPTTGVDITVQPDKTVNIAMNESEKKFRKYVRTRLEEKAGLRKPSLNENKKSETLKKLDKVIDEQFKLYENVVLRKKDKVNEGEVNEILGFSIKEKFAELDPNDEVGVNALFQSAFKNILINPMMSRIGDAAKRATTPEKYNLIKQYAEGGGGTLRLDKSGRPIYMSKQFQSTGVPSKFTQGGTQGKTAFGGV